MTAVVHSWEQELPRIGQLRADAEGVAWWLVLDLRGGYKRLTRDPGPPSKEQVLSVFRPSDSIA